MTIPTVIQNKFFEAFGDMGLQYENEVENVTFKKQENGAINVLHDGRYVCSFNERAEYGHRFDWRNKWLHVEDYIGKGDY